MKIFFIRHAPTAPNLTGAIVKDYSKYDIIEQSKEYWASWKNNIAKSYPEIFLANEVYSSMSDRAYHTAQNLFDKNIKKLDLLNDFDCEGINGKQFWDMSQKEFEKYVDLTPIDMKIRIDCLFECLKSFSKEDKICVSHGMLIRYIWHYLNNAKNISAYDILNSKNYKFKNLDTMVVSIVFDKIDYVDTVRFENV